MPDPTVRFLCCHCFLSENAFDSERPSVLVPENVPLIVLAVVSTVIVPGMVVVLPSLVRTRVPL